MTTLQVAGPARSEYNHAFASPIIDVLTTEAEVVGLLPEWDALWHRVADASPFISPDWLWAWWRHLGGGQGSRMRSPR